MSRFDRLAVLTLIAAVIALVTVASR